MNFIAGLVIGFFVGFLAFALTSSAKTGDILAGLREPTWKSYRPLPRGVKPSPPKGGTGAKKKAAPRKRYQRPRDV